jgi:hypothetical protein
MRRESAIELLVTPHSYGVDAENIQYLTGDYLDDLGIGDIAVAEFWEVDGELHASLRIDYGLWETKGYLHLREWRDMVERLVGRTKVIYERAT